MFENNALHGIFLHIIFRITLIETNLMIFMDPKRAFRLQTVGHVKSFQIC